MPRRYADYLPEYTTYHRLSTIGSWIMVTGLLILIVQPDPSAFASGKPAADESVGRRDAGVDGRLAAADAPVRRARRC